MTTAGHALTDDKLGAEPLPEGAPTGQVNDPSYKSRRGDRGPIAVIDDDAPVEDPIRASEADSDKQLGTTSHAAVLCPMLMRISITEKDDAEAIDKSNILEGRTRNSKPTGKYAEPTDKQMGLTE
jgi:hypothetical protein